MYGFFKRRSQNYRICGEMEATKKLRQEQIKRYNEYEKSFQDTKDPKDPLSKRSGSRIGVETEHLLKDAAKTNDLEESTLINFLLYSFTTDVSVTELLALESEKISQQVKNEALFTVNIHVIFITYNSHLRLVLVEAMNVLNYCLSMGQM